jgi:hypothetical protein
MPCRHAALGVEFKEGVDAGDGIENSHYWDFHLAWFATEQLTLAAAWVATGDEKKGLSDLGLGGGVVLGAHYAF